MADHIPRKAWCFLVCSIPLFVLTAALLVFFSAAARTRVVSSHFLCHPDRLGFDRHIYNFWNNGQLIFVYLVRSVAFQTWFS